MGKLFHGHQGWVEVLHVFSDITHNLALSGAGGLKENVQK